MLRRVRDWHAFPCAPRGEKSTRRAKAGGRPCGRRRRSVPLRAGACRARLGSRQRPARGARPSHVTTTRLSRKSCRNGTAVGQDICPLAPVRCNGARLDAPLWRERAVTIKGSHAQLKGAAAGAEKWTTGYGGRRLAARTRRRMRPWLGPYYIAAGEGFISGVDGAGRRGLFTRGQRTGN